jgi:hypothetical protein
MFLDRELGLNQFGYLVRHAQSGAWKPDDRLAYSTALGGFLGLYPELETSAETVQLIRESVAAGLCVADEGNPGWLSR